MEMKLMERIQQLGYNGELTNPDKFVEALKHGPKSPEFTELVAWLANEIAVLIDMDESIHSITSADDSSSFLLEVSCFLKELGCVNERLITGNVNTRLGNEQDRYMLLDFLGAELKTCRLLESQKQKTSRPMAVQVEESDTAKDLKDMLIALNFEKPPDNITAEKLFTRLENKLKEVLANASPEQIGQPLITNQFTEKEWKELELIQQELHDEYKMRRDMLLKRLDITIQSFLWSDRIKPLEAEIKKRFNETRKNLHSEPNITFADLLAARDDIAKMEKTSNANVRKNTQSEINKVIIGTVPDRGGRPYEQEAPPPEMPPWQKDRVPGPSGGGGRGGGGQRGGRGGGSSYNQQSNKYSAPHSGGGGSYGNSSGFGDGGFQGSNYSSTSGGYGGRQGGGQGGGYGGGQGGGYGGGHGGGQGGGYGGSQGGGYGGGQGGYGGGQSGGYGGGHGGGQGGGYGGSQGGGYGGGQGGYGGGQSGGYGGGQGGGYGGSQSGYGGGQGAYSGGQGGYEGSQGGYGGNRGGYGGGQGGYGGNSHGGENRDNGSKGQYQRGGSTGRGRGGRVQGGWNQGNSDNYQRGGYNRGGGRGGRQY